MSKHEIPPEANVTLQLQYRKCGKKQCNTCRNTKGHGPYFYGYWKDKATKKLVSHYFGKDDPRGSINETAKALVKRGQ